MHNKDLIFSNPILEGPISNVNMSTILCRRRVFIYHLQCRHVVIKIFNDRATPGSDKGASKHVSCLNAIPHERNVTKLLAELASLIQT